MGSITEKKKASLFVNRRAVKALVAERGFMTSGEFITALNAIVRERVETACRRNKLLKRETL